MIDADETGSGDYQPAPQAQQTITITPVGPPTVSITSPADHRTYNLNQPVPTSFSCTSTSSGSPQPTGGEPRSIGFYKLFVTK